MKPTSMRNVIQLVAVIIIADFFFSDEYNILVVSETNTFCRPLVTPETAVSGLCLGSIVGPVPYLLQGVI